MARPPVTSRVLPVEQVFQLGSFSPASVQRDYQWRTSHCLTLLTDIDRVFLASPFAPEVKAEEAKPDADDERVDGVETTTDAEAQPPLDVYMLGAIVLVATTQKQREIYDGLQRLTTLTILLAVLRDLTTDRAMATRIDESIRAADGQLRLALAGRDTTLATQIQPRGEAIRPRRAPAKSDMGRRIRIAAQAFREKLKPWSVERRNAFARFLLERVYIDVQQAADERLARQIFVTTNMRGSPLDPIDLFKGQLTDIADNDETAAQVVGHWNGLRLTMGDRLSDFLLAIDFIERHQPQGSDCLNLLADHIAKTRGPAKVEAFVQGLSTLGADYNALMDQCQSAPTDAFSADIWRLQIFRWTQWRPLALVWFSDYRRALNQPGAGPARKIEATRRRFNALHRRCMGLVLAGFSAGDRETIFGRAISQVKSGANPLSATGALAFRGLHLSRISDSLRLPMTDQDTRSTLIRWLESVLHGAVPPGHVRNATVEHILPRRPEAGSEWTLDFSDIDTRYLACHALGNLAAIDRVRNETIRNATFPQKRDTLAAAANDYKTLADIAGIEQWSLEEIEARTQRLANTVEQFLDLPIANVS